MFADVMVGEYAVPFGPPLVALSPDGKQVFFSGTSEIHCANIDDEHLTTSFHVDGASVRSLAMQPSGRAIVAGCSDGSVRYWDLG
jgi:WD40 repeat protein